MMKNMFPSTGQSIISPASMEASVKINTMEIQSQGLWSIWLYWPNPQHCTRWNETLTSSHGDQKPLLSVVLITFVARKWAKLGWCGLKLVAHLYFHVIVRNSQIPLLFLFFWATYFTDLTYILIRILLWLLQYSLLAGPWISYIWLNYNDTRNCRSVIY